MSASINIYDLDNGKYLEEDINDIIVRIDELYLVTINGNKISFESKLYTPPSSFWASAHTHDVFNKSIPKIKSLHKDMHSVIEACIKWKFNSTIKAKYPQLVIKYTLFDKFCALNNKFKHFSKKDYNINLTSVVIIKNDKNTIMPYCNFRDSSNIFSTYSYSEFIELFLRYLLDNDIVTITS